MKKMIAVGFLFVLAAAGAITSGVVTATPALASTTVQECEACGYPHAICVNSGGNPCTPPHDPRRGSQLSVHRRRLI